ncbi:phosphodiester glycosidase family protein [Ciceribacter thiooxidans]|uniref:Phosphodiester glycosidase family protein n=1 Tax=Ciceribacter thiooxidans TaxID=1969821 RepID=A0ABV7HZT1_9HYPH|nr:phosphodiester glycosidase family protein [Ciceribacter thiooxidans]
MRVPGICGRGVFVAVMLMIASASLSRPAIAACRDLVVENAAYTVCDFDPKAEEIRVYHSDPDGKPFSGFDALVRQLWEERHYLVFATNGGMYHDDLSPVGLLVEYGIERRPITTKAGWGNFHLLPNGVFSMKDGRAAITESRRYARAHAAADYATQSGPMLVIEGALHPKFLPDSDSFKIRNGVGVDGDGKVHFVISNTPVRFYDFARLFRDTLGCPNALYLDGTISSAYIPERGRRDRLFPLGPIIAVIGTVPQLSADSGRTP